MEKILNKTTNRKHVMSHLWVIVPFLCADWDTVFTLGSVTFAR